MNMLSILQRLAELDPTATVAENTDAVTAEAGPGYDPDYGPYRGHPGDPRTPEPSDEEESADMARELLQQMDGIDGMHDVALHPDLQQLFMQTASEMRLDPETQFQELYDAVQQDLEKAAEAGAPDQDNFREPDEYYEGSATDFTMEDLSKLSGIKRSVSECGAMMGSMPASSTPASINITAGSGSELSTMLKDIMSLAGVHKVEPQHMPLDIPAKVFSMAPPMRQVIDTMNDVDNQQPEEESMEVPPGNTPADPTDVPAFDNDKLSYKPNAGGDHRERQKGLPVAEPVEESINTITSKLFTEYQNFLNK